MESFASPLPLCDDFSMMSRSLMSSRRIASPIPLHRGRELGGQQSNARRRRPRGRGKGVG